MTTPRLPHDRFPIIPPDWSAEQAYAAFELLDEITERIWARYAPDIQALIQQQQRSEPHVTDDSDPDLTPF